MFVSRPFFGRILLQGILFLLTFPTFGAFGGRSLVPKGRPRPKVLATLAPLDFGLAIVQPDGHVTGGTKSLVLAWNNVVRFHACAALEGRSRGVSFLSAHDAVFFAICALVTGSTAPGFQIVGIVDDSMKLGKFHVLGGI